MRAASVRSSAKDPRPEPSTSPIPGRSAVCESTNAAADSARAYRSRFINTHCHPERSEGPMYWKPPNSYRRSPLLPQDQRQPALTAADPYNLDILTLLL